MPVLPPYITNSPFNKGVTPHRAAPVPVLMAREPDPVIPPLFRVEDYATVEEVAQTPDNWFKPKCKRIDNLDPSKPVKPEWTAERILDVIKDAAPSLTGAALMCPCCFKQMRPEIFFNADQDAVLFTLSCCFGSDTLYAVSGSTVMRSTFAHLKDKLRDSATIKLINLKQRLRGIGRLDL